MLLRCPRAESASYPLPASPAGGPSQPWSSPQGHAQAPQARAHAPRQQGSVAAYLGLCLIAAVALTGCGQQSNAESRADEEAEAKVPVEVGQTIRGTISATYQASATLEADREALLVAKVPGQVVAIAVEEGDTVAAGEELARIDDERYRLEVARARATLDRLSAELQRSRALHGRELMSAEDFERARFEYDSQTAVYELARIDLADTRIRAPFDGVIAERLIKVGNTLGANEPTFRLVDPNPLLAVVYVPEADLGKLAKGQPARLRTDAFAGVEFAGEVLRISPVVDPDTGTVKVTIAMEDATERLRAGMFGRLDIRFDTRDNAVLAPRDAIVFEDTETSAYVVVDGRAQRRSLRLGYSEGELVEVIEGLAAGETVVTTGQTTLSDGTAVERVPSPAQPSQAQGPDTAGAGA